MARDGFASIESTASAAEAMVAQGRWDEAERCYRGLIAETHVLDYEYDDWLRSLADVYRHLDRPREAGYIYLYLHFIDRALDSFPGPEGALDRARVLQVSKRYEEAATAYMEQSMVVHAAYCYEKARDYGAAASAWESLLRHPGLRDRPYELALVHFNYGMASEKAEREGGAGRRALIESLRRLEQVADEFETRGERERAFDCYGILIQLGRESKQFENAAEGYLNCIRVLKDDNLKFYVLQYYEDFIQLALERGELHAAATLYQEAADYAARSGLPYDRVYQLRGAETWVRLAERHHADQAPIELVENAVLAAIGCYSSVGDYGAVREQFIRLAELDLGDKKRARYQAISERYAGASSDIGDLPEFPEYLKTQLAYADVWFIDLLEWELSGDPWRVAASIVGDLRYPDGIRRRALVTVLTLAHARTRSSEAAPETLSTVADQLGELQSYAALSPLERLYEHDDPAVRRSSVRSLRFLTFKRSFVLIRRALADGDSTVREAAIEALQGMHFPHAFNPLARVYREDDDPRVRETALESIGKIQSIEAGEFLLDVLRQEDGRLREVALGALRRFDNTDVIPIIRQYSQVEGNPQVRELLRDIVQATRA